MSLFSFHLNVLEATLWPRGSWEGVGIHRTRFSPALKAGDKLAVRRRGTGLYVTARATLPYAARGPASQVSLIIFHTAKTK
ncbi:hypothetical protein SKAU_G00346450 [Synaphobranchus kaupii]|uniref:Uncharacterized protein n=1 Tax=Synaphobranchus kaupii TaxID=118154 RepID=A0A9Q1EJN3_SYNKA|nr:hypothetical protein SKAU_G00346450 [Synaphobranchus kaupii]